MGALCAPLAAHRSRARALTLTLVDTDTLVRPEGGLLPCGPLEPRRRGTHQRWRATARTRLLEHADTRRVGSLPRSCALGFASASRSELTACNPPVAWLSVPSFQVTTQPQLEGLVSAAVAADKTLMVRWIASER